ncbi:M15 family metallopeptidase [Rhodococcus qingshengii]|uniref:M15 family metallopeptidase n=1 Tax=Rhodococcus qingshengii TaxID=334542 RepID=A0AAW6LRS9_RHOSG|nr:M15 family metallopeptidase [Rhodococcus qingshengii]MDE8648070.1 M15 family metallopeptidase [Rhodococcus qingshengii]
MALITENGWSQVNSNAIVKAVVPGTEAVRIEVRGGVVATILNAWAAWYHGNVETIDRYRPRDYWGWSATNAVSNSNHLSGTAIDLCATQYPWGSDASWNMPPERIAKIREGLRLFDGTIFWGQDWSRKDPMHFQINYPEGDPRLDAFALKLENGYLGIYADEPDDPDDTWLPGGAVGDDENGTYWADVSQYQAAVNDLYPHPILVARSNSGNVEDTRFFQNAQWAKAALDSGRLAAFGVYYFFRPGQANCDLHKEMLVKAGLWQHPRVFTMIDVEGDGGKIRGDHSAEINDEYSRLVKDYGNANRVIGYLNPRADPSLWTQRPGNLKLVVPHYNNDPGNSYDFPGRFAHQYSDRIDCAPFGACDANFTGMSLNELLDMLSIPRRTPVMSTADDILFQLRGSDQDSLAGNTGFVGLRPYDGYSQFLGRFVDRQSIPEALGTLVFESTYRVAPYRNAEKANTQETVLGHAAAGHGAALDANEKLDQVLAILRDLATKKEE